MQTRSLFLPYFECERFLTNVTFELLLALMDRYDVTLQTMRTSEIMTETKKKEKGKKPRDHRRHEGGRNE